MSDLYLLSRHVHVCVAGRHAILLDLERDKYLAVTPPHRLARWVKGWPAEERDAADSSEETGRAQRLLEQMLEQGMLVTDPRLGKEAVPVEVAGPRAALIEFDLNVRPAVTAAHVWRFIKAYAAAKTAVKLRPIKSVVQAARSRKRRGTARAVDLATMRGLVGAYAHLRPLFFTAQDACLLDSLTLINFLASYGIFPDWVFGVKTEPFRAHCWVQQSGVVFNDTADYARGFAPILVV